MWALFNKMINLINKKNLTIVRKRTDSFPSTYVYHGQLTYFFSIVVHWPNF